jgi:hypothetical protein
MRTDLPHSRRSPLHAAVNFAKEKVLVCANWSVCPVMQSSMVGLVLLAVSSCAPNERARSTPAPRTEPGGAHVEPALSSEALETAPPALSDRVDLAEFLCDRKPGPPLSRCEAVFLRVMDPWRHLFGPDESELSRQLGTLRIALEGSSTASDRSRVLRQIAETHYFRERALTRACHEHQEKGSNGAAQLSRRAHEVREELVDTLEQLLRTSDEKRNVALTSLALSQQKLARFSDAAASFGTLLGSKVPEGDSALFRVGQALALHLSGEHTSASLETIPEPSGPMIPGEDPHYRAFGAATCMSGQWAEEKGDHLAAKRHYARFLSWTRAHPDRAKSQDVSFLRLIEERAASLESSGD